VTEFGAKVYRRVLSREHIKIEIVRYHHSRSRFVFPIESWNTKEDLENTICLKGLLPVSGFVVAYRSSIPAYATAAFGVNRILLS
jgi:hypothetical protein